MKKYDVFHNSDKLHKKFKSKTYKDEIFLDEIFYFIKSNFIDYDIWFVEDLEKTNLLLKLKNKYYFEHT